MDLAKNIWGFGPQPNGPNLLVDACEGGAGYSNQIKGSLVAGFKEASKKGCLTQEEMKGICFNLLDDAAHCNIDVPILRKAIYDSHYCYCQATASRTILLF
ncbi:elongation factor 2 [Tanacetum coccineum]